jgi:hypothetical protein
MPARGRRRGRGRLLALCAARPCSDGSRPASEPPPPYRSAFAGSQRVSRSSIGGRGGLARRGVARATAADLLGTVTQRGTHCRSSGGPLDLTIVDLGKVAACRPHPKPWLRRLQSRYLYERTGNVDGAPWHSQPDVSSGGRLWRAEAERLSLGRRARAMN